MAAIKNATVKRAKSGFYLGDAFNGVEYDTTTIQGGDVGTVRLLPLYGTKQGEIELDIVTLTLLDETGEDVTPADIQERAELLALFVAKRLTTEVDVNIQDQTTEIIDLHLSSLIQVISLNLNTNINDITIQIGSAAEPIDGNIICLKESAAFYQGEILSHSSAGAGLWDIVLDTPLDFAFTTVVGCSERSINLAVDGSVTPVIFTVSPGNLTPGIEWDIVRFMGQIIDDSSMDDSRFGGLPALQKGVFFRSVDGITKNIFNAKTNGDLKAHMYDVEYSDKAPAGLFGLNFRRTFAGQSKNGVAVRLKADSNDEFQCIVQDDLTGLVNFQVIVQGHVTDRPY